MHIRRLEGVLKICYRVFSRITGRSWEFVHPCVAADLLKCTKTSFVLTVYSERSGSSQTPHGVVHLTAVLPLVLWHHGLQAEAAIFQDMYSTQRHVPASGRPPPEHVGHRVSPDVAGEDDTGARHRYGVFGPIYQYWLHCNKQWDLLNV